MAEPPALRTGAATTCPAALSRFTCRSSGYTKQDRTFT
uniref:Uncharacterized protein n=1 Tax=Rhizophora mucronata TaxID=61149 RepID=A0A2P2NXK0_RHIMU